MSKNDPPYKMSYRDSVMVNPGLGYGTEPMAAIGNGVLVLVNERDLCRQIDAAPSAQTGANALSGSQ